MKLTIDSNFVDSLKSGKGGSLKVDLDEVASIYRLLDDGKCRVILMGKMCFILFKELPNVELPVTDYGSVKDFDFIDKSKIEFQNVQAMDGNYALFLWNEFFQGNSLWRRIRRSLSVLVPVAGLNLVSFYFADKSSINEVFSGLLAAVSIFVAIFSLFVTSHDYLTRKKLSLFESAHLSYYFAVDKYITRTGIYAIVLSIFGLIATSSAGSGRLYELYAQNVLIIGLLNIVFVAVFIILRSMVEFYIIRPGKFIMGDLKAESARNYWKTKN